MLRRTVPRLLANRLGSAALSLSSLPIAMTWGGASPATGQAIRTTVASAQLEGTTFPQWIKDLGYRTTRIYPLTLAASGCPFVDVDVSGVQVSLMLDTGTASGLVITTNAPPIPHRVEGREQALNPDGSHRGESVRISLDGISVLGQAFRNVAGTWPTWRCSPRRHLTGPWTDFFLDRRVTLDYRSGKVATASSPLPEELDRKRYLSLKLVDPLKSQGHILYARARVNGREAIVYLDTGYNVSFISPDFAEGLTRVERPGKFKVFREGVPVELDGRKLILNELRESPINRGAGFDLPVALALGSDFLSRFIVTIDIRAKKLILALAE